VHHPLIDCYRFGARPWVQTIGREAVDDPLEAERDRGQYLLQGGQIGPDDVIQVQDLPLLARHDDEIPLRDHEHTVRQATLQREVGDGQPPGLAGGIDVRGRRARRGARGSVLCRPASRRAANRNRRRVERRTGG